MSVASETSSFVNENVKVTFVKAAETAQGQVADGKVFGRHLSVVQGYLVYTFFVANTANQTGNFVIIDVLGADEVAEAGTLTNKSYVSRIQHHKANSRLRCR